MYAFQNEKEQALQYLSNYAKLGFENGWHDFIWIDLFLKSQG